MTECFSNEVLEVMKPSHIVVNLAAQANTNNLNRIVYKKEVY